MPTVIASAGTSLSPSGRPGQSHLVWAANAALWWIFWVDSASPTTLRSASSPDGTTWTTRATLTLSSSQDRGSNFAVAYKNISSTDVLMFALNYYVSATQQRVRYVRATISGTTLTFGTEGQIIADINTSDTSNNEGGIAVAFASDNYAHIAQSLAGGGGTSDYGWSYLSKATNADAGSSWSAGWPSTGVSMNNGSNYNNADVILPSASGTMLWIGTDMAGYLAFTDLTYKIQSTWTTNFTGNVLAAGITSQDQNDWHACRVSDTNYHAVIRTGSNTYTHRTCNGSTWAAGASITNQNSKAGAGLFLCSDGTDVWLFIVDSDAANTIRYCKYTTSAGTWSSWTALVTTTKTRTFLSGYPIASNSLIGIVWSEVNGSNKDITVEFLSLGGGGGSVAIIATDRVVSRAGAAAIAARAVVSAARTGVRISSALPAARQITATDRAGARAGAALPVSRALVSTDVLRSRSAAGISVSTLLFLVASARVQLLAQSAAIASRSIVASDLLYFKNAALLPVGRGISVTDILRSRAGAALPAARAITSTDRTNVQDRAAVIASRSIAVTDRISSRAGAALPTARALQATLRVQSRSTASTGAGFLLLYATVRIQSRTAVLLPVGRSLVAQTRISARSLAALPVSRALQSIAITRAASVAAATRLVAIAASARVLGMTATMLPVMRSLAAQSVMLSKSRAAILLAAPVVVIPGGRSTYRPAAERTIYRPEAERTIYRPEE